MILAAFSLAACNKPIVKEAPKPPENKDAVEAEFKDVRLCKDGTHIYEHEGKLATFQNQGNDVWVYLKDGTSASDYCSTN